jgi:hypothetical protein
MRLSFLRCPRCSDYTGIRAKLLAGFGLGICASCKGRLKWSWATELVYVLSCMAVSFMSMQFGWSVLRVAVVLLAWTIFFSLIVSVKPK